jgi:hypothetical protein
MPNSTPRVIAYRRRHKDGLRRLPIDVTKAQLDWLEAHDYLDPFQRGERADEADAVEAYLMDALAKSS